MTTKAAEPRPGAATLAWTLANLMALGAIAYWQASAIAF